MLARDPAQSRSTTAHSRRAPMIRSAIRRCYGSPFRARLSPLQARSARGKSPRLRPWLGALAWARISDGAGNAVADLDVSTSPEAPLGVFQCRDRTGHRHFDQRAGFANAGDLGDL